VIVDSTMAAKDKESKTLQDKLKQFFKINSKQSKAHFF